MAKKTLTEKTNDSENKKEEGPSVLSTDPVLPEDRKVLHEKLDFILDYGHKGLTCNEAGLIARIVRMTHRSLRDEVEEALVLPGKTTTVFPGLRLGASILKLLGLNRNSSVRGFVRWGDPMSERFTPVFSVTFNDWEPDRSGGRLTCLQVEGIVDGARVGGHDSLVVIDHSGHRPRFLCPHPKKTADVNGCCRQAVDELFLPAGQTVFGCASCHPVKDRRKFWSALELKIEIQQTKEGRLLENQERDQKQLANRARVHLSVDGLLRDGFFTGKPTRGTLNFKSIGRSWSPLRLGYAIEPVAKKEWILTLTGQLFGQSVSNTIRTYELRKRCGAGFGMYQRCVCPNCGRKCTGLELVSGMSEKFLCDKCRLPESEEEFRKREFFISESPKQEAIVRGLRSRFSEGGAQ